MSTNLVVGSEEYYAFIALVAKERGITRGESRMLVNKLLKGSKDSQAYKRVSKQAYRTQWDRETAGRRTPHSDVARNKTRTRVNINATYEGKM